MSRSESPSLNALERPRIGRTDTDHRGTPVASRNLGRNGSSLSVNCGRPALQRSRENSRDEGKVTSFPITVLAALRQFGVRGVARLRVTRNLMLM